MFVWWQQEEITPKYPLSVSASDSLQQTFYGCSNLKVHPPISIPTDGTFLYQTYRNCQNLVEVTLECIGVSSRSNCFHESFYNCFKCVKIAKVVPIESHTFSSTFTGCKSLVDITFDGVIGNNINFQDCPLSVDSMISIITHLKNYVAEGTGNEFTRTVYFNDDCWARLEASGIVPDAGDGSWISYVNDVLGWDV